MYCLPACLQYNGIRMVVSIAFALVVGSLYYKQGQVPAGGTTTNVTNVMGAPRRRLPACRLQRGPAGQPCKAQLTRLAANVLLLLLLVALAGMLFMGLSNLGAINMQSVLIVAAAERTVSRPAAWAGRGRPRHTA